MFGLAAAAACMPSHEDWLNDLSLTPPKSLTMHPVKWAVVVVVVDLLGCAHPAASRATAASAAPACRAFLTCYLLIPEHPSQATPPRRAPAAPREPLVPLFHPEHPGLAGPRRPASG